MIDGKQLDKWTEMLKPATSATFSVDDANELIRLAHLGLWAEKYLAPAVFSASGTESFKKSNG